MPKWLPKALKIEPGGALGGVFGHFRRLWEAICGAFNWPNRRFPERSIEVTTFRLNPIAPTVAAGAIDAVIESTEIVLTKVWVVNLFGKFVKRT